MRVCTDLCRENHVRSNQSGEAKVGDLYPPAVSAHKNVLGFEVTMDDVVDMHPVYATEYLAEEVLQCQRRGRKEEGG